MCFSDFSKLVPIPASARAQTSHPRFSDSSMLAPIPSGAFGTFSAWAKTRFWTSAERCVLGVLGATSLSQKKAFRGILQDASANFSSRGSACFLTLFSNSSKAVPIPKSPNFRAWEELFSNSSKLVPIPKQCFWAQKRKNPKKEQSRIHRSVEISVFWHFFSRFAEA